MNVQSTSTKDFRRGKLSDKVHTNDVTIAMSGIGMNSKRFR